MPNLSDLTRSVLARTTALSDRVFGSALETSAVGLAEDLQLPAHFVLQLLAVEDKRFLYHPGVDILSVLRALFFNLGTAPSRPHGASTITQQIYSNSARQRRRYRSTLGFKISQSTWALKTTLRDSKLDILRKYLDSVYFGRSFFGLTRAANGYCKQLPGDLTIAQSFFLVDRIATPNKVNIRRIAILTGRRPIASILRSEPCVAGQLATLYERHFSCGEVIARCLEKSLRSQVVPTSSCLGAVLSEQ